MIVLSDEDCMVDIAKFYLTFTQEESCGKCTPCREGTTRMLEILEKITAAAASSPTSTGSSASGSSASGRASAASAAPPEPGPLLAEALPRRVPRAHRRQEVPAKKCVALIQYVIDDEKCIGCTACARNCPTQCISGERKKAHVIDQARCIKCGQCYEICRFDAVERV
jgi:NADH:ubiquinone oxidoreductase, NADH-binding (51 kD) subunit